MKFNKLLCELKGVVDMDVVYALRKAIKKIVPKLKKDKLVPNYADIEEIAKRLKLKYRDIDIEYVEDEIEDIIGGKII